MKSSRSLRAFAFATLVLLCGSLPVVAETEAKPNFPLDAKRILFLGDSITHGGGYIAWIEAQLRLQQVEPLPEIINLGLSSETASGLSEPKHPFPRPDVHERVDRALAELKPDVVVVCYGMNDGIYYPFSEERFGAYRKGIDRLIDKAKASGARVILMTPPPFDRVPLEDKGKLQTEASEEFGYTGMYADYDSVLKRYAEWIMQQNDRVAMTIDLHSTVNAELTRKRKADPKFTFARDGIHPNAEGHRLMGQTILRAWGLPSTVEPGDRLLGLLKRRVALIHDAWLSKTGHKRPGVRPGLPIPEMREAVAALEPKIDELVRERIEPELATEASTGGTIHRVRYVAAIGPDQLPFGSTWRVWIPEGVKQLRGVIVHQHGCGEGAARGGQTAADDLHWQALARKHDCALLGPAYEPLAGINCRLWCDPRNGSDATFRRALTDLAKFSKHPELDEVPWCLWGHSGGGFWASLMQTLHPERCIAIWLRSGTALYAWEAGEIPKPELGPKVFAVPVMANPGADEETHPRFGRLWDGLVTMRDQYRKQGAFLEFAPDPYTGHNCGDSRYLAIPFFDFWLTHRLPEQIGKPLRPVDNGLPMWKTEMTPLVASYITNTEVADPTPPPAPTKLRAVPIEGEPNAVKLSWTAEADLESGIRGFLIERDGVVIQQPTGASGPEAQRPTFQGVSYHDTPNAPLSNMEFIDRDVSRDRAIRYRLRTVNTVGTKSAPVEITLPKP